MIKRICVFSGSSPGLRPEYTQAAQDLAREIVARQWEVVYGGSHVGLMGVVADAALRLGGWVIGVIPHVLVEKEVAHTELSELRQVDSMHERKAQMAALSDGFVALPGGFGTIEELFEVLTWVQLGIHGKPCGLLNVQGYFDHLIRFLDHTVQERFVRPAHRKTLLIDAACRRCSINLRRTWPPRSAN